MFTPDRNFRPIDARVCIGHVHLKVSDLEKSLAFYCGVLGFELIQRWGTQAAFILLVRITIISVSTHGKAVTVCRHRREALSAVTPSDA